MLYYINLIIFLIKLLLVDINNKIINLFFSKKEKLKANNIKKQFRCSHIVSNLIKKSNP